MNLSKKVACLAAVVTTSLFGAGWKIPEQSINSTALSAAYVAGASGADSSYFNPANMVNIKSSMYEFDSTYLDLSEINYKGVVTTPFGTTQNFDIDSKGESFVIPAYHFVTPDINGYYFGFSITTSAGLSKRWGQQPAKTSAEKFSLEVLEINPTIAYPINEKLSIGAGIRFIKSSGKVKSDGTIQVAKIGVNGSPVNGYTTISRDMEGDGLDYGFNLALSYKINKNLTFATTYRSNIYLKEKGKATLTSSPTFTDTGKVITQSSMASYDDEARIEIILPAVTTLAVAYRYNEKTMIEFLYEKNYWSEYKDLDFSYSKPLPNSLLKTVFADPKVRNWNDTDTFRVGVTHTYSDKTTIMAGFALDESPAPTDTVGFELPDNDAKIYSAGVKYKANENVTLGLAYLLDVKDDLIVEQRLSTTNSAPLNGKFTNTKAHLVTLGAEYKF